MIAYKLLKLRKDGTLGPLFINARQRIPVDQWLKAEDHPTKGFAHRPGWHCTFKPEAPHLSLAPKGGPRRVWCRVEIDGDITVYDRPALQGGSWVLATMMRVDAVLPDLPALPDGFTVERSTSVPANHRTGLPYVVMGPAWNHPPESGVRGSFGSGRTPDEAIVRAVRFLAEEGAS